MDALDLIQDVRVRNRRGILLATMGILIISPDGLLLRLAGDAGLWEAAFIRTLAMGVGLSSILLAWHRWALPTELVRLGWGGMASILLLSLSNIAFVAAMAETTVANTLVIFAATPLFGAVLGRLFIGETVHSATWLAIAVAISGIGLIVGNSYGGLAAGSREGDAIALLTAILIAANLVVLRRFPHVDATIALGLSGFASAAFCWPHVELAGMSPHSIAILAFLGGIIIPLSLSLYFRSLRYLPAAEVALFALIETVLGPMWAWVGVGETPGVSTLIGGAVVVGAIVLNGLGAVRR